MTYTFFDQKFDSGVNEVLSWFGINLMVSFQDITQNMFCNLAKISHPADLVIYYKCISTWSLLLSYIDDMLSVYCAICY